MWLSVVWIVAALALGSLGLVARDLGSFGLSLAVAGLACCVGILFALWLVALNASLDRGQATSQAAGPAGIVMVASAVLPTIAVTWVLLAGRPHDLPQLAVLLSGAGITASLFIWLFLIALGTRHEARGAPGSRPRERA